VDLAAANEQDRGQADATRDQTPNLLVNQDFLRGMTVEETLERYLHFCRSNENHRQRCRSEPAAILGGWRRMELVGERL
jgi:hypothetical protein